MCLVNISVPNSGQKHFVNKHPIMAIIAKLKQDAIIQSQLTSDSKMFESPSIDM
ncbi:hypothetical protein AM10699_27130 [Acaryochloris marina MBIC10699]|nr:hypothetical protein AM10699_27130 [Acaryochloris marina MBIC10699]